MQAIHIDFCYSLLILTALTEVDTEGQVLLQARKIKVHTFSYSFDV